jgi:hypothetical protein
MLGFSRGFSDVLVRNAQDGLPEEGTIQARLRERAVPMLCAMAHSTQRGRAALGAADGAGVLLGLLRDPPYQVSGFGGCRLAGCSSCCR